MLLTWLLQPSIGSGDSGKQKSPILFEVSLIEFKIPNLEENFYQDIEAIVQDTNETYINAIIHWCAEKSIEIEYVAELISKNINLKAKLQAEGENLHFLRKTARVLI